MGMFPTGVTVVAARNPNGTPLGLTVNSFTSVSLDPPMVLVCIDREASSHDRLVRSDSFAVSILSTVQAPVARTFAQEPSESRFEGVGWATGPTGDPLMEGCAAWVACSLDAVHPAGDHSILVGRVQACGVGRGEALAFYRSRYGAVES
jgi:flavin reductase (DIM6/NTAB) family NADH-FMN oxidoreductase RutF